MKYLAIASVTMLLFIASCGGEAKKVSQDSKTAVEAFAAAEAIKEGYIKGEMKPIENNTTREGYRTIMSVLKKFESAELSFNHLRVEITADRTLLHTAWKGKWKRGSDVFEERGTAVFVLTNRPLKVDNILRSNPFRYPE